MESRSIIGMDRANLYNLIYGMELFKPRFHSVEAYQKASVTVLEKFEEAKVNGTFIGPIDFNRIEFDMESGEVSSFPTDRTSLENCSYDLWKFLPEEFYTGAEWNEQQDLYCLAVLLYALRYYSLPYDGIKESKSYSMNMEQKKENYRNLGFVFSEEDQSNALNSLIGSSTISFWNDDENGEIKTLFSKIFSNRADPARRPQVLEWKDLFGASKRQDEEGYTLSRDGVSIRLIDGLEIFRRDISSTEDDRKLGVVVSSNKDKKVLALGNTSEETWRVDLPDGQKLSVAPKSAAPIAKGAVIDFGFEKVNII